MAERATAWHGFMLPKGVERTAETWDVKNIPEDDYFAVQANLGCANAKDWEAGFISQGDVSIASFGVADECAIVVEHEISGARIGARFLVIADKLEDGARRGGNLGLCKVANGGSDRQCGVCD